VWFLEIRKFGKGDTVADNWSNGVCNRDTTPCEPGSTFLQDAMKKFNGSLDEGDELQE